MLDYLLKALGRYILTMIAFGIYCAMAWLWSYVMHWEFFHAAALFALFAIASDNVNSNLQRQKNEE
jgi:hypothetical protein